MSVKLYKTQENSHRFLTFLICLGIVTVFTFLAGSLLGGLLLLFFFVSLIFLRRLFFVRLRLSEGDIFIFYGLPGSGKTLFLTKVAEDNKDILIGVNSEFSHYKHKDFVYDRSDLGKYDFGSRYALFFDEASLNGFDARNHSSNFADESILAFFKKIRHAHGSCVLANQGREEVDLKIRDNLCNRFYYCQRHSFCGFVYCTATVLLAEEAVSEITGLPIRHYKFPSLLDRLRDPTLRLYAIPRMFSKLYDSYAIESMPIYPYMIGDLDNE